MTNKLFTPNIKADSLSRKTPIKKKVNSMKEKSTINSNTISKVINKGQLRLLPP